MVELLQHPWVQRSVFAAGGVALGLLMERVVVRRARKIAERTSFKWDDLIVESIRGVPTVWVSSGGLYLALTVGTLDPLTVSTAQSVLMVLVIGSVVVAGMMV